MKYHIIFIPFLLCINNLIPNEKIAYVKSKYEHNLFGQSVLFYPASKPKRLLISFCAAGLGPHYSHWSMFWNDNEYWDETAYLFLYDATTTWYLGSHTEPLIENYCAIIKHFVYISSLCPDQVFTFGGSMGGYGAAFYAVKLGLKGTIIYNAQVDKESAFDNFPNLCNLENQWQDLHQLFEKHDKIPLVSIIFHSCIPDTTAAYKLLEVLKKKNTLTIMRKLHLTEHTGIPLSKKTIEQDIDFMENQIICPKTGEVTI
jgi:hypothetical protein